MTSNNKRRLASHIKAAIACNNYRAGDKLPSLRLFAEQFGMTVSTVRNTLLELEKEHLLTMRHGDGIYIAQQDSTLVKEPSWKIAVFTDKANSLDLSTTYSAHALQGLQEEAAANDCRIEIHFKDFYHSSEPLQIDEDLIIGSDACVFLSTYDRRQMILPTKMPIIGLQMSESHYGQISSIGIDPFTSASLACDFFRKRNISKVKCLHFQSGASLHLFRAFRDEFAIFGSCTREISDTNHPDLSFFDAEDIGYLVFSGTASNNFCLNYEKKFQRQLTNDFTVLSVDGKSRYLPSYRPISNIGIDWRQAGKNLLTEALYRIHNPDLPGRRILMMPDIQELNK